MNSQKLSLNEMENLVDKKNKIKYIDNFKWSFRLGFISFIKTHNPEYNIIEIDPGGGCMESRDIERWQYLGFGFYKNTRKNITFWLDQESDFSAFRVRSFLK